jgi:hypothetical protein
MEKGLRQGLVRMWARGRRADGTMSLSTWWNDALFLLSLSYRYRYRYRYVRLSHCSVWRICRQVLMSVTAKTDFSRHPSLPLGASLFHLNPEETLN